MNFYGTLEEGRIPIKMKANYGFGNGHWVVIPNTNKNDITKSMTYVYYYDKLPVIIDNPIENSINNPIDNATDNIIISNVDGGGYAVCSKNWRYKFCRA